jgi:hypothetical protein
MLSARERRETPVVSPFRKLLAAPVIQPRVEKHPSFILPQKGSGTVDWKAELAKAKAGIEKNAKSAFWHNQAGSADVSSAAP